MEKNELVQIFYEQRAKNKIFIAEHGDDDYHHYGRGTVQYDTYFKPLLESISANSFQDLLRSRTKVLGRKQRILDLFAPPSSFLEYQYLYDSQHNTMEDGIAVTLMDTRRTVMLPETSGTVDLVVGDLLRGTVWESLRGKQDKKYDLIVCRPQSPFRDRSDDGLIYFPLLKKAWDVLSEETGMMFVQLPRIYARPGKGGNPVGNMDKWEKFLSACAIPCTVFQTSVRPEFLDVDILLQKTINSPAKFPRFAEFMEWNSAGEKTC